MVLDILLDALKDTALTLPFLFLAYLALEYIEHRAGEKMETFLGRAGKCGPVIGAGLGLLPQCGFSTAVAGLYSARIVSLGTLFAVLLSTSDEMLILMITGRMPARVILTTLAYKFLVGTLVGFLVDLLWRSREGSEHIHDICEEENCHCEKGIFHSALVHTGHIILFILIVNLVLGALIALVGEDALAAFVSRHGVLAYLTSALIGLVPNCAASVVLTELFCEGVISFGAMMAGLLPGAGVGIMVLLRQNHPRRSSFAVIGVLYVVGVLFGALADLIPML